MLVANAQREIRQGYLGGFVGQLVSAILWLGSAGLATWDSQAAGIRFLVVGGFFIYPLTRAGLALIKTGAKIPRENPLNGLAMQVAFTLPLVLPVVGAAALYRIEWFYPAFMIVLGAHYLPFVFLYGMRMFAVLAAGLVMLGLTLALYIEAPFATGGWITGVLLLVFAFLGRWTAVREQRLGIAEASG